MDFPMEFNKKLCNYIKLKEYLFTLNQQVGGSNPPGCTKGPILIQNRTFYFWS